VNESGLRRREIVKGELKFPCEGFEDREDFAEEAVPGVERS
jgi:hypothetical protein